MTEILYRDPTSPNNTLIVGEHETVRRRILEESGWQPDSDAEIPKPEPAVDPADRGRTFVYRYPGTDRTIEVEGWEVVRRRILEEAGWTCGRESRTADEQTQPGPRPESEIVESTTVTFDFTQIDGVNADVSDFLNEAGFHSFEALREAKDVALRKIPGIGSATLDKIREHLKVEVGAVN